MSNPAEIAIGARARPLRTSELLREFARSLSTERVTVGEIVEGLGDRGLGVLIAIFALPNILPSAVPFGNVAFGVPPLIFAFQLMLGLNNLMLAQVIARRTVGTRMLKALAPRVAAVLSWFEPLLSPRLSWVTSHRAERVIGAIAVALALVTMLPIPFLHNLPSLGLVLIGLGLIERDGLAILGGAALGMIGTFAYVLVVFGLVHGLNFIIRAV